MGSGGNIDKEKDCPQAGKSWDSDGAWCYVGYQKGQCADARLGNARDSWKTGLYWSKIPCFQGKFALLMLPVKGDYTVASSEGILLRFVYCLR